jgi:hypothetical protein
MYSSSSARVDYRQRLELNTQDSDEDALFRQEMNPDRGAGGFSGLRRAGAGENRASPPVQQLDVSEYLTASEAGSERGRSRHRGHPENRPSVGGEDATGVSIRKIGNLLAAGRRTPTRRPTQVTTLEAGALGQTRRRTGHPCRRGRVRAHLCLPGDYQGYRFPGRAKACSSPGETAMTLPREATADPCRGVLRQATGQGSPPHRLWDLDWRLCRA